MVEISDQLSGRSGLAVGASTISAGVGSRKPSRSRKARWRSAPISWAMRAVPMFEDFTITSRAVSSSPWSRKSRIVNRPQVSGPLVSISVSGSTMPSSIACATVTILNTDPSS
jgi:hypothetical protein